MRVFETIAAILALSLCLRACLNIGAKKVDWLIEGLLLFSLVSHWILEGLRWQMVGIYVCAIVFVVVVLSASTRGESHRIHQKPSLLVMAAYVSMLIVVLLAIVLSLVMPVTNMEKASGPYEVGTMTYDLFDKQRVELYGDRVGEERKFRIQLWYPADSLEGLNKVPWNEDGVIVPRGLMQSFKMPYFIMDHTALILSNSYGNAPLLKTDEPMPVVIMSHGWTGFRNLHTDIAELLASYGYMVVGVDHSYGSVGMVFENGDEVMNDPNALPERGTSGSFDTDAKALVHTYAEDSRRVLDHLQALNSGDVSNDLSDFGDSLMSINPMVFTNKINLNQIGAFGHSTGGGGLVELSLTDNRVKAVVGMDPWVEPIGESMLSLGMKVPTMFFRSSQWAGGINDSFVKILASNPIYSPRIYEISGSKHQDFTMIYIYGPTTRLNGLSGDLPGRESAAIQQDFILQFFDSYLRNQATDIEVLVNQYPVVEEVFHIMKP